MTTKENNNKTIIIPDLHGRPFWDKIVIRHPEDQIVFLGDYFDSKEDYSAAAQISNFNNILTFKRSNADRVTLLLGNHDFHYLPFAQEKYGGYQHFFAADIYESLKPAVDEKLLNVCMLFGKYLISHAGLTRTWCRNNSIPLKNPVEATNTLLYTRPEAFRFSPGPIMEPTGDEPEQGPLWVRPYSLSQDYLQGFVQVVGHTQHPSITHLPHAIFTDVLGFSPKYLTINEKGATEVLTINGF